MRKLRWFCIGVLVLGATTLANGCGGSQDVCEPLATCESDSSCTATGIRCHDGCAGSYCAKAVTDANGEPIHECGDACDAAGGSCSDDNVCYTD